MIPANTYHLSNQTTYTPKEIIIEPKQRSPFIKFNGEKGILMIKGNAIEKDVHTHILSLIVMANEFLKSNEKLTCYFFFKDFNPSTCKALFDLFKHLKRHRNNGKKININWFADYHNTEMIETGIDYSDLFDLKFNIQPV